MCSNGILHRTVRFMESYTVTTMVERCCNGYGPMEMGCPREHSVLFVILYPVVPEIEYPTSVLAIIGRNINQTTPFMIVLSCMIKYSSTAQCNGGCGVNQMCYSPNNCICLPGTIAPNCTIGNCL